CSEFRRTPSNSTSNPSSESSASHPVLKPSPRECASKSSSFEHSELTGLALALGAEAGFAVDADVQQQAEPEHDREHCGAAIGDQRQRHADNRDQAHHHCGVDEHI